tara:strand:+ start:386 stop:1000 length:615 start_codon:yes stop_codon:yes gene_type:complete
MKPQDFKVILWDFDGVIINSNSIREAGFRSVLNEYSKAQIELLIDYHNLNGGLSRYVKFRYFFKEIINEPVNDEKIDYLANEFSKIMRNALVDPNLLISPIINFINEQYNLGKVMHIVSGSDGNELRELCKKLNLEYLFVSINGSPTPKSELVKNIISSSKLNSTDYCLIGDAINDYHAAQKNLVTFFGFNNLRLKNLDKYFEI